MNNHINTQRIDSITANEFNVNTFEKRGQFIDWLEGQTVNFESLRQALKVYRGIEVPPTTTSTSTSRPPRYTEKSFKSRQQLNSFLRQNGFKWAKLAPMNEFEESEYGECFRWALLDGEGKEVSVSVALEIIGG